jgi:hypothetical protein
MRSSRAADRFTRAGFQGARCGLAPRLPTSKSLSTIFSVEGDILYPYGVHLELLVGAAEKRCGAGIAASGCRRSPFLHAALFGRAGPPRVLLNELDNLPSERRADVIAKQRRIIALVESQIREVRPDLASGAQARALTMLFFG